LAANQPPANQQFTYSVLAQGRLTSPEQFENVVVREAPDGGIVRVKDVARVELGEKDYSVVSRLNAGPPQLSPFTSCPVPMRSKPPEASGS